MTPSHPCPPRPAAEEHLDSLTPGFGLSPAGPPLTSAVSNMLANSLSTPAPLERGPAGPATPGAAQPSRSFVPPPPPQSAPSYHAQGGYPSGYAAQPQPPPLAPSRLTATETELLTNVFGSGGLPAALQPGAGYGQPSRLPPVPRPPPPPSASLLAAADAALAAMRGHNEPGVPTTPGQRPPRSAQATASAASPGTPPPSARGAFPNGTPYARDIPMPLPWMVPSDAAMLPPLWPSASSPAAGTADPMASLQSGVGPLQQGMRAHHAAAAAAAAAAATAAAAGLPSPMSLDGTPGEGRAGGMSPGGERGLTGRLRTSLKAFSKKVARSLHFPAGAAPSPRGSAYEAGGEEALEEPQGGAAGGEPGWPQ